MKKDARMIQGALGVVMVGLAGSLLLSVSGLSADAPNPAQTLPEQRIEIAIHDYEFQLVRSAPILPGLPTVVIVRNQDAVRHGLTSPMLIGLLVQGEGEGVAAYGKGVEGFYVDPGKTLVIRFNNQRPGRYSFHCDIHPQMKGEMYVMDIPAA